MHDALTIFFLLLIELTATGNDSFKVVSVTLCHFFGENNVNEYITLIHAGKIVINLIKV